MAPLSNRENSDQNSTSRLKSVLKKSVVIKKIRKTRSCPSFGEQTTKSVEEVVGEPDLTFLVGPTKQPFDAHSLKLAASSPVFRTMLQFTFFAKTDVITVDDVTPLAFKLLLKSIYEGVTSLKPELVSIDLALDTYYAAHKYHVTNCEDYIVKFIHRATNIDSCLQVLHHAEFYGIISLQSKCWSIIEKQTLQVVRSDYFPYISWNILCGILENSRLRISEYELFYGMIRWCEMESCLEQNQGKTLCQLIGVAIYKIRFPLMSEGEFRMAIRTGILNSGEIADLRSNFKRNKTYCHVPRKNWCFCRKSRIPCPLCFTHEKVLAEKFVPVDGLVGCYKTEHNLQVISSSKIQAGPCECMKYFSCPAFPNGTTAEIIETLGGWTELKKKVTS